MKGICFKEPLFNSIIEGVKTQTRRIVNIQPNDGRNWGIRTLLDSTDIEKSKHIGKNFYSILSDDKLREIDTDYRFFKPKYKVGEIVYLKEPYKLENLGNGVHKISYLYGGECKFVDINKLNIPAQKIGSIYSSQKRSKFGYANKLFMPNWAAQYFMKITNVRAERLKNISDEDCIKEGIENLQPYGFGNGLISKDKSVQIKRLYAHPKLAYAALINSINGKGTWESNPFVWVYDYELITD